MRCVRTRAEQLQILAACHVDPTAGHLRERRTTKRISERYMWRGIVKDVQEMVIPRICIYNAHDLHEKSYPIAIMHLTNVLL